MQQTEEENECVLAIMQHLDLLRSQHMHVMSHYEYSRRSIESDCQTSSVAGRGSVAKKRRSEVIPVTSHDDDCEQKH